MIELQSGRKLPLADLLALYDAVGWSAYTRDSENLARAIANSTYVMTAWQGEALVGLARCLSDDVAICYVQDILVTPALQGQGVGKRLLIACLERFAHVRMCALMTDDEPRQLRFYESLGFTNTQALANVMNAFVYFGAPQKED